MIVFKATGKLNVNTIKLGDFNTEKQLYRPLGALWAKDRYPAITNAIVLNLSPENTPIVEAQISGGPVWTASVLIHGINDITNGRPLERDGQLMFLPEEIEMKNYDLFSLDRGLNIRLDEKDQLNLRLPAGNKKKSNMCSINIGDFDLENRTIVKFPRVLGAHMCRTTSLIHKATKETRFCEIGFAFNRDVALNMTKQWIPDFLRYITSDDVVKYVK